MDVRYFITYTLCTFPSSNFKKNGDIASWNNFTYNKRSNSKSVFWPKYF